MEVKKISDVLQEEAKWVQERRKRLFGEVHAQSFEDNKFGIALSGGGIRSATINLGFLKTLNQFRILEKADYLSSVSGGGYTGAYIQTTVREAGYEMEQKKTGQNSDSEELHPPHPWQNLFDDKNIDHLRKHGDYLIPGQTKWQKLWSSIVLAVGYLSSWVMSLLSLMVMVGTFYLLAKCVASLSPIHDESFILNWNYAQNKVMDYLEPPLWALLIVWFFHFVFNLLFNFHLDISKWFNKIEAILALGIMLFLIMVGIISIDATGRWEGIEIVYGLLAAAGLFLTGFALNPNSLSFHSFYRKQLADAFLWRARLFRNVLLKDVFYIRKEPHHLAEKGYLAPYPLINTCLNLQNPGGDDKFKGAKASDYFLLSPMFCGSKLSGYVKTAEFSGYRHLTLPAAITISAAAVNPGMGIYSNKTLSVFMTLLNARLGFWVNNPAASSRKFLPKLTNFLVWWPSYFYKELFSKIGTRNRKLNISDGGHIENLAVYELLRRQCRLIIAVDAGADPGSTFSDLENLAIRARNELGIEISFRPGQDPADVIRPRPTSGYAQRRFAIADLLKIWEEFEIRDEQGQPVTFQKKVIENGRVLEKTTRLEALVNYFYSKTDPKVLKFRVDLKALRDFELPGDLYDRLQKRAVDMVREKFNKMQNKTGIEKIKIGTFVYVKSSVTPPRKLFVPEYGHDLEKNLQFDTFKYKIYHPEFPHESTADQFFDPVQWESYYQLGQFIAIDVLDAPRAPGEYNWGERDISIDELIEHFDNGSPLFDKREKWKGLEDATTAKPSFIAEEAELEVARPRAAGQPAGAEAPLVPELMKELAEEMQFKI